MNSINNLPKLLFGYGLAFFPLFLLTGPLIPEIFLIVSFSFFIFYMFKDKKFFFLKNRFIFFFFLFYLSTLFSTLINFYSFETILNGLFYFRVPMFAISIWFLLEKFNFFNKKIVFFISLFLVIIILDALLQYYTGKNVFGYEILANRVSSFFAEELILGGFIMRTLPIFMIYLVMSEVLNGKKINFFYIFLIACSCFIVYVSGERTSFGLLILFFFTLYFISKYLRKFILIVTITFLTLSLILPYLKSGDQNNPASRMFKKTYNQFLGIEKNLQEKDKHKIFKKIYLFSPDHHAHYLLSLKIFKDHIIFGTGTKGFRYLCRNKIYILEKNDGCSTHPHNTYIQILVSNGIVGFLLLIFAFLYLVREIFVSKNKINSMNKFDKIEISKAIAISAIFVNIWPLIPSGNFFNNWLSMFYFYPIGLYLYFKHKNEEASR